MNKRTLVYALLLLSFAYSLAMSGVAYGQAASFLLEGTVREATGAPVGAGFTVEAINQRAPSGWLVNPVFRTRTDGSYTINYIDPFGGRTTNVGDEIRITVTDPNGEIVGRKSYIVTQADVNAGRTNVDVLLSGILVEFSPGVLPADGTSTSTITVTVQDENGQLVTNDTLTITPEAGKGAVGNVTNNGDGTYTATYTAPSLLLTAPTTDTLVVRSTALDEQITASITLQVVPTVIAVTVTPNTFSADSTETGEARITVNRGVPVTDADIRLTLARADGRTDTGAVSAVTNNGDGTYTATYTPAKTAGRVTLTATETRANVSATATITINAGPPSQLALSATPGTVSSGGTSLITATAMDAAGNGVGGLTLDLTSAAGGAFGAVTERPDAFGVYSVTYTAPIVVAETTTVITATISGTDVNGQATLNLTPAPPVEVNLLVITGMVFKKGGVVPAAGVNVTVTVGNNPAQVDQTAANGLYSITLFNPLGVVARTGDVVEIVVTDASGAERGRVPTFALTNDELGAGGSATIRRNVQTDIGSTTSALTVAGVVYLEDGQTPVQGGLNVSVSSSRGPTQSTNTDANGNYSVQFIAQPPAIVAETDDVLTVRVTDTDGDTFETTHTVSTDEVEAGRVNLNVTTDFIARESRILVVEGTVYLEDGVTPARPGLGVLVKINDREATVTTEAGSVYQVTFVDVLGADVIAQTGDVVDVEVTVLEEGRVTGRTMHTLTTAEVRALRARVDVATDLTVGPTNLLVVTGTVRNPNGSPVEAGLSVTVTLGANPPQTDVTAANGTYSLTFFNPLGVVARPGDSIEVRVVRRATGETAVRTTTLKSFQALAQRATVDVQFPSVFIEVEAPETLALDNKGRAAADIIATVTDAAGGFVAGLTATASLQGVGNVTPRGTDNGDGTYTFKYTVDRQFGTARIAVTTSAIASPTETVEINVIDNLPPTVVATAEPNVVALGEPVTLDGRASTDNVEIDSYSWDFDGDGIEDSASPGPVTFRSNVAGVFAIKLTVTDTAGNEAVATVEVIVGGLSVRGRILEADGQPLQTNNAVVVRVTHRRLGVSATGSPRNSIYTIPFNQQDSDRMLPGDELVIEALSAANLSVVLGRTTHILTNADVQSAIAQAPAVTTNRTSVYTIRGQVLTANRQPIPNAVVKARGRQAVTNELGVYTLVFSNYLTNPVVGELIEIIAEIPLNIPRRTVITAFATPDRVVQADLSAIRLGGLSLNTQHYRQLVDKVIGLTIAETEVGQLIGGEQVMELIRANPELQEELLSLIKLFIPQGLFPEQLIVRPNLPRVFDQAANIDLENFGNGITASPVQNVVVPGFNVLEAGLPRWLNSDKLDLYVVSPDTNASRVTFTLSGPRSQTIDAQRVNGALSHTFLLEEEQAILFLPSWPGPNGESPQVFAAVTLMIAQQDLVEAGPAQGFPFIDAIPRQIDAVEVALDAAIVPLEDSEAEIGAFLTSLPNLPANLETARQTLQNEHATFQADIQSLRDLLELVQGAQNRLQADSEIDDIINNLPPGVSEETKQRIREFLEKYTPDQLADLQAALADLPAALERIKAYLRDTSTFISQLRAAGIQLNDEQATQLENTIFEALRALDQLSSAGLSLIDQIEAAVFLITSALANLNRLIILPPEAYQQFALQPRRIGEEIVWAAEIDIEPGKVYYYYYDVQLIQSLPVNIPGLPSYTVERWAMPDPRNLQIEDRGIVEALITEEFQRAIAPILDPIVSAVINGQPVPPLVITPAKQQELIDIVAEDAQLLLNQIIATADPLLASLFTAPAVTDTQSVWVGKFDLPAGADGKYEVTASVFNANGDLIDQIAGKQFTLDRTPPKATVSVGVGQNAAMYQRADGTFVATALPTKLGDQEIPLASLTVTANPTSSQPDLAGYLYQLIGLRATPGEQLKVAWAPLPVVPGSTSLGNVVEDLLGGLLPADQLGFIAGLADIAPITFRPPHKIEMLLRGKNNNPRLLTGEFGIRAVGVDTVLNIASNTAPLRLTIVPPEADIAQITKVVIGDCNGDGDTDDTFESGSPTEEDVTIFSNIANVKLTVEITKRTAHPLVSIVVQFKMAGESAQWQNITALDAQTLSNAAAGSQYEVDWAIDFAKLIAAGDRVMVRAVATNALTLADTTPQIATLKLDPDVCPVAPEIIALAVTDETPNPDSGGVSGEIVIDAFTHTRTAPATQAVRFEIRRLQDTAGAWQPIGQATTSTVIEGPVVAIIEDLIGAVVGGEPSVSIASSYRKWSITYDASGLDDTITADSPAARDATKDENPYVVRAVLIDVNGAEYEPGAVGTERFSVDNIDDLPPGPTRIVAVADAAGAIEAVDGVYTVSALIAEGVAAPLFLTAQPTDAPASISRIDLLVNRRNPDGTPGEAVDLGEVTFNLTNGRYVATLDLGALEDGAYLFQALATDAAGNREERDPTFAIAVNVENFRLPADIETNPNILSIMGRSVAEARTTYPGGVPASQEFTFTLTLSGLNADEIDVLIDGESARALGLISVVETQTPPGGAAAAPAAAAQATVRSFIVTVDTSTTLEGRRNLSGRITKRNGAIGFGLPAINVDRTGPVVTIVSPLNGHEVSALPTIHATYQDANSGIDVSDPAAVTIELVRLTPPTEVPVEIDPATVLKGPNAVVYTRGEILPGGAYRVTVRVADTAGNTGAASAEFTVVRTLPAVSILSPLPGQITDNAQPLISAVFTGAGQVRVTAFSIDDAAIDVTPEMIDGNRLLYTPPEPLADGSHTVAVEIQDGDGDTARASVTFTVNAVDATPPVITQVSPQGVVRSANVTVSVAAFDEQSGVTSVTLSVDGDTAVEGASRNLTNLAEATHNVVAVVTNGAGLETTYPWSFTVELDSSPPVISEVAPQGVVRTANVTLSAVATDDESAITRVTIALDGGTAQAVPTADIQAGRVSRAVTGLTDGTHTATIVAQSAGGSTTHTWTFTVELDTTRPIISEVAPQGVVRTDSVTISAVVTDSESAISQITIALDGGAAQAVPAADIRAGRATRNVTGLDSGTHTVTIVAQSAGGSTTHTWTFTVELDETPPAITATAPHGIVRIERPTVSVSAADDMSGVDAIEIVVRSGSRTINGRTQTTGDGTGADFTPSSDLTAGTYSVEATVTDNSGNEASTKWSFTVEFDTVAPSVTIVSPPGEARVLERQPEIAATYTDSASGIDEGSVKLSLDGTQVAATVTATQVKFKPTTELEFGRHTVRLEVSDLAPTPNTATQEWNFIVESDKFVMVNARNFPNPFTSTTTIAFTLAKQGRVTIEIFDMAGRFVRELASDELMEAGPVRLQWNGTTAEGDELARGVYFYQITVKSELKPETVVKKMALMRSE